MVTKKTEIGALPSDWNVVTLLDCLCGKPSYGINAPAIAYSPQKPRYIRITDITEAGTYSKSSPASVEGIDIDRYYLKENDIVLARTGASVGKSYLYQKDDGNLVYAGFLIKASINDIVADARYVSACLHTQRYWQWVNTISVRSGQPGINGEEYSTYLLPLPPRPEQAAIAGALSDVDNLISSLQKLIAKKKAIKQGTMQELLTGKKRLPGFSGEWSYKPLGILGDLSREVINPQSFSETFFYEYSMPAYDNGRHPEKALGGSMHSSRLKIYGEVILFNKLNVRQRRVWYVEECLENAVCSSEFLPYHPIKILPEFLYQVLLCDKTTVDFENMSTGTSNSQKRITPSDFLDYKIFLPEKDEQQAIAQVLSDMDSEIEHLEKKLAKYQQIKRGMMQELLTGRIRLVDGYN